MGTDEVNKLYGRLEQFHKDMGEVAGQQVNRENLAYYHGKNHHALSGLVVCGRCGWGMAYCPSNNYGPVLRCNKYSHTHGRECQSNSIIARKLETWIYDQVRAAITDPTAWLQVHDDSQERDKRANELAVVESEIARLTAAWQRWNTLYETGGITDNELLEHRQRLLGSVDKLKSRQAELQRHLSSARATHDTLLSLRAVLDLMPHMTPNELRQLYSRLIARIAFTRGQPPSLTWIM